jgi:hypothetical protein
MVWIFLEVQMHNGPAAEWIVGRWTSKERAAAIVGDLLEIDRQKGPARFWFAIVGTVFWLAWRRCVAFVAAFYAANWALSAFIMALHGVHAQHAIDDSFWMPAFDLLTSVGALLWFVLMYAAIRYGLKDHLAQLAVAWTALASALVYLWWRPVVLAVCLALAISVLVLSILDLQRRRAAAILLTVLLVGYVIYPITGYFVVLYRHHILPGPWGSREVHEHPSLAWMVLCMRLMTTGCMATACSRMHNRLLGNESLRSEPGH